jgi:hypothetical protein
MNVELTVEQFDAIQKYFEFSLLAMSDDEQAKLVFMEKPLRDMLRGIRSDQSEILANDLDMTDLFEGLPASEQD